MLYFKSGETVAIPQIPTLAYAHFRDTALDWLQATAQRHVLLYYAYPLADGRLKFLLCLADDASKQLALLSHEAKPDARLLALTADYHPFHIFEREIWERYGIDFQGHPWLKPVRYPFDRKEQDKWINDYPFYQIKSQELHEVGVGPIHAGVIEPGHFRFQCNGEMVLHLEIQLGWQHRGVEWLFLEHKTALQRTVLAESIAGDTAVGHATAHLQAMEGLLGLQLSRRLQLERAIALEWERVAMHLFDLSNLCTGLAYQLGAAFFGALRTPVINFFQEWCGNRMAKGLLRLGGSYYPLNTALQQRLRAIIAELMPKYEAMALQASELPSLILRLDEIGKLSKEQMQLIGAVGGTARMAGLLRDVRSGQPWGAYQGLGHEPILQQSGDVWARFCMRRDELPQSIGYILQWLDELASLEQEQLAQPIQGKPTLAPNSFSLGLVEGWRGEIAHAALTDEAGQLRHYKAKDPSLHNWMALALALRHLEISDFPINNKSFDLSYCGNDL